MSEEKLARLKTIVAEIADLTYAAALLGWDQQVNMPPGGAEGRGYQLATLQTLAHDKITAPETGQLLDDLQAYAAQLDPDSDDARYIKVARRQYDKQTKVPGEWIAEFAQVTTMAHQVWAQARAENNFALFQPSLERIMDLRRRYADFFAPYDHVYDPLLDDFEPGLKTADVKAIFNALRPQQVELIKAITAQPQVDNAFLYLPYDEQKQWDFGVEVITKMGHDWKRSRQDKAAHPFTTNFGVGDVRITTRVYPEYIGTGLFGTLHEAGHASYELGVDPRYDRGALAGGASLAVHESQSRMWENLVGRSYPFWQHFYPRLQEYFPSQLGNVSLDAFYKGINKVQPSLIRVEADEATYNLHIMLRLELEIALMEGTRGGQRPARGLEHPLPGIPGHHPAEQCQRRAAGCALVERLCRLLLHLCAGQPDLRPVVGAPERRYPRPARADPPRRVQQLAGLAALAYSLLRLEV